MKEWFIKKCPNWLFPSVSNLYYSLSSKQEKAKIKKSKDGWLVQKGGIELLSPSPKFVGFGLKAFENKFERFFKIEEGDTALDVGACIGDTTVPMAIKAGSNGKVIAVEAYPPNIPYLEYNLRSFKNAEIICKAIWEQKGSVIFNASTSIAGGSVIKDLVESKGQIEVPSDTLDNLFNNRKIDFAKIDVQNAEAQVLAGGSKFLETIGKLIVETHCRYISEKRTYPRILEILGKYNFKLHFALDNGVVYAWRKD
jgi:FkbM family methyltransferase